MIVKGVVGRGNGLGKKLGFPTVNINIAGFNIGHGIYVCKVMLKGKEYNGVMHYGPKSVPDRLDETCEIHLLDFDEDVYGEPVSVTVLDKIRETRKFDSEEELAKQIELDVETAKTIIS
ncbi:MAG: riboflavin kinase [Patescibacteria group bacterium]|nr:riboflavin kinase [Patescibacteria group bacterium]